MGDVLHGEGAAAAVFEPFLRWLVAADVEIPCQLWHAAEVLGVVDVDAPRHARCSVAATRCSVYARYGVWYEAWFFDHIVACYWVGGDEIVYNWGLHEVELAQLAAEWH